jgi:hypothetical protein
MLRVMRDETVDHAPRDAMAKAVAPWRRLQRKTRFVMRQHDRGRMD